MTSPAPKNRSFLEDALRLILGNFGLLALALLVGIATARIWKEDVRGVITAVLIVPSLLVLFGDFGIDKALPTMMAARPDEKNRIIGVSFTLWLIASILYTLLAVAWFFAPWSGDLPLSWYALSVVGIGPSLHLAIARGVALADQRISTYVPRLVWAEPPKLIIILTLGALLGFDGPSDGWVYFLAMLVGSLISFAIGIQLIRSRYTIRFDFDATLAKEMIAKAFKFGISTVLMRLNYRIDLFILSLTVMHIADAHLGNYSVGVNFANMLWQIPIALSWAVFSRGVNTSDRAAFAHKTARLSRFGLAVGLPAAIVTYFAAPWILPLVYGPGFRLAATCTQILLPGIVAFFVARTLEADLHAKGHPLLVSAVMGPVVVANIVLNAIWVPQGFVSWAPANGVLGAAWASTVTYIAGTIGLVAVYSRITGIKWWDLVIPRPSDFRFRFIRSRR